MTTIAFKKTNQNTQEVKHERFLMCTRQKTTWEFLTYVAFNTGTTQTYITGHQDSTEFKETHTTESGWKLVQ